MPQARRATPGSAARSKTSTRFSRRRFHEVCVLPTGHSNGRNRSIFQHEDYDESRLMQWRNNLTALSKRYNLYLVAGGARIWAYEPQYPSQNLTRHPQLSIDTDPHPDTRPGDFHPERPDVINHLIIAGFGDDEIVVCACDDGDVYAYYTRAIYDSIQELKSDHSPLSASVKAQIRPFFHKNVTRSAWGLAVHQQARLIAASCNAHDVYVFAFALHDENRMRPRASDDDDELPGLYGSIQESFDGWELNPDPHAFVKRDKDYVIRLESHGYNIPAVAFCNTSDDPEGRYLASTDIYGTIIVWDVIDQAIERYALAGGGSHSHSGWALHFLDKRSFRRSDARTALTDKARFAVSVAPRDEYGILDISRSRNVVARSKPWFPWADRDNSPDDDSANSDTESNHGEGRATLEWDAANEPVDVHDPLINDTEIEEPHPQTTSGTSHARPRNSQVHRIPHSGVAQHPAIDRPAFEACLHPSFVRPVRSRYAGRDNPPPVPLSPLMRFSADTALLFQSAMLEHAPPHQPYTIFHGPLSQEVPADWALLMRHMDRLNLTVQLDDLGLVLAGSPKGRVAVFSLHQIWPNPLVELSPDPLFAFRLDAVLPLPADEAMRRRPSAPLVGVAAGPVQGHFGHEAAGVGVHGSARHYRVMMLYRDHSMLCYEVWRDREVVKDGVGTGVGRARRDVPFV